MIFRKKMLLYLLACFSLAEPGIAQQPQPLSPAVERLFNKVESDILTTAEAMPEARFFFTPDSLSIKGSDFKGVRSFAGQLMHLATDNMLIWSAVTGDSVRADIEDVNGPKNIKTKPEVISYVKSSFAVGHRALSTLNDKNALDMIQFRWRKLSRLDLVFYALVHASEHYGQMVVYLRMCGVVPPPTVNEK